MSAPGEDRRDEDLDELLADLRSTLDDLRRDLRADVSDRERERRLRPPSLREVLRFTEEYTIPAAIETLEATVRSLELLRRALRTTDPERAVSEETDASRARMEEVGRNATDRLAWTLDELRVALDDEGPQENAEVRSLVDDVRNLSAEIERRVAASRREADRARRRSTETPDRGPVSIDVVDENDATDVPVDDADERGGSDERDDPEVDIDSELRSIKDEVDREFQPENSTDDSTDETESDGA